MKQFPKSLAAAAVFCMAATPAVSCTAAQETAPMYYDAAAICPDDVAVSRDITADYAANSWTMAYHFENNGTEDAVCYVEVPVVTTLDSVHQDMYSIAVSNENGEPADARIFSYFTPLFSAANLSEDNITAEQLHEYRSRSTDLPTDSGTIYTIKLDEASAEAVSLLTVRSLSDNGCRIYPIGCSYTAKEGTYEISANREQTLCYVFITGKEDSDFSLEEAGFDGTLAEETSSLDSFIDLSCELFLEQTPLQEPAGKEVLMQHLTDYIGNAATVSLDLIPSLEWIVKQHLFEVYACEFTVLPGETLTASIVNNSELPVNAVSVNPVLTENGTALASNQIHIIFKDDYTRAALRMAKGSFDQNTSTLTVRSTDGKAYQVVLSKTPLWVQAHRYIVPMCIVMVVFLAVCVAVYLVQKKAANTPPTSKN